MLFREYTTIAQVKAHKMPNNVSIQDDDLLLAMIRDVCAIIDRLTGFTFYPYVETRKYDAFKDVDGYQLLLDRRILEITAVTNAGDSVRTPVTASQYVTDPRNNTPYYGITLLRSSGIVWFFNVDPENAISVTGTWGYHTRYVDLAWQPLTTLGASTTASSSAIQLTFADAKGDAGTILKVDSELMYLYRRGTDARVIRGINGSTVAAHDSAAVVYAWHPEEGIEQIAREATVLKIIMRDDPTAVQVTLDGQAISVPKDIEGYIRSRLRGLGLVA